MSEYILDLQDQEELPSSSTVNIKKNLNERRDVKFMSNTITKGFFASQQYIEQSSPSYLNRSNLQVDKNESPRKRRNKKQLIKLEPLGQKQKIEVFKNQQNEKVQTKQQRQMAQEPQESKTKEDVYETKRRTIKKRSQKQKTKQQIEQIQHKQRSINMAQQKQICNALQQFKIQKETNIKQKKQMLPAEQQSQKIKQMIELPKGRKLNNIQFHQSEDSSNQQQIVITKSKAEAKSQRIISNFLQYFSLTEVNYLKTQIAQATKENTTLKMELYRDKSGFNTFWPQFHLSFDQDKKTLMSAKKTSNKPSSTFILSTSTNNFQQNSEYYLGKLKSNILGDILNLFGPGDNPSNANQYNRVPRQLLATIVYSSSIAQLGKPRQFIVYVKKPNYKYYYSFNQMRMYEEELSLDKLYAYPQNKDKIQVYYNRKPIFNTQMGGYMLNFKGRVQCPSIKNFILESQENGRDLVLFGKVNQSKFNVDVSHPISPLVAFAIILSSFDSRVLCQ